MKDDIRAIDFSRRALICSASMTLVAGVDSSTQSTKVLVVDSRSGKVVRESRCPHPDGTEVDPQHWLDALHSASRDLLSGVKAISIAGQQHGMVLLDGDGDPVRPALLWNDTRSARAAADLVEEFGGPQAWAREVGTVPVASLTVTKLRWTAREEPRVAAAARQVMLPHDWLTWHLLGRPAEAVTDRGDASGTGYFSTPQNRWRPDLLELGFGRSLEVPRVCDAGERAGVTSQGLVVAAGTGDNMAAALGAGAGEGDVLVSIGTSGTVFASTQQPACDVTGAVAGFADARGGYLPLVATLNAARVLAAGAAMLGVDLRTLDELALQAAPGAGGLVLLPYLEGERTPNRPDATGRIAGLTGRNASPANLARAVVEGMLCGLADGLDALVAQGTPLRKVLLFGGGARSSAVQEIAPAVFGVPVTVLKPQEYVALGAARQAVWALEGAEPEWKRPEDPERAVTPTPHVREAYAALREETQH